MGAVYSVAKKIHFKIRNLPILGALLKRISPLAQRIVRRIDSRTVSHAEVVKQVEVLSQGVVSLRDSVKGILKQKQAQIDEYRAEVEGYRARLEFVRLEILEECAVSSGNKRDADARVQAKILSRDKYDAAIAETKILLNIGCGHKPIAGYLNVDRRSLPGVDVVAEADGLPFESGTVSEIYAAHLVEHFTLSTLKNRLFPYWLDMLAQQGTLKIIVPDMSSMIAAYTLGDMSFSDLSEVTFGAQDYGDDFHYAMFSPQSLKDVLISSGFKYVDVVDENRVNGKCREMEVWARKF